FRFCQLNAGKMSGNIVIGIVDILCKNLAELVYPFIALWFVGTDQGMHAQYIHTVIVGKRRLFLHPVTDPFVVYNVIASYKSSQIKGFAGSVESGGAHFGILAYRLGR